MTRGADRTGSLARLLVVGVGNPDRGDDGIGPLVARQLLGRVSPSVAIIERSGDALALIDDWAGRDAVILVDAAAPGAAPGQVHRIDLLEEALPPEVSLSSTHAFGVAEAVGLAHTLGLLPARVIAYAIEGANFDPGAPVSPKVAAAAGEVATRVAAELRRLENELAPCPVGDGLTSERHGPALPRHGPARPGHRSPPGAGSDGPVEPGHDGKRTRVMTGKAGHDEKELGHDEEEVGA
jgi:hydrogenase maturation protease